MYPPAPTTLRLELDFGKKIQSQTKSTNLTLFISFNPHAVWYKIEGIKKNINGALGTNL